ncbi:MAG: cytochrome bd-type quinol oxidase subunit 1 [Myxococcaceae bacterium]|nr:cytochrome bd-type quinol oxidase subunit 1 [Myxococcaceae bacterium]
MSDLLAARLQMGTSLGFHIVFACIGMTMPWLMALASYRWLRTRDPVYRDLAKAWSKGVAVFFAVGAVSGTVLSLELGLLWPNFMEHAGPIIGLPFSWEGTAFFIEAIALGLFLYGWERLPERVHFASGVVVGISGVFSGVLVVAANAWMNSPRGFRWVNGRAVDVDPIAAMFNDAWATEALHMVIAAFVSTCFAVAGVHALRLLRSGHAATFHRKALRIALGMGSVFALLQPLSGDLSAKDVAKRQPAKLAAMEAHYHTERAAKLLLFGIPDDATGEVHYGIEIPYLLSVLAKGDPQAEVQGLDQIPKDQRPPTLVCHIAFQVMVGCGVLMMGISLLYWWLRFRRPRLLYSRGVLRLIAFATPLGFIAVEAGWTVTEVGRQPWIIYGVMRTSEAVSPMPGLVWPLLLGTLVYVVLVFVVIAVMTRVVHATESALEARSLLPASAPEPQHA